jgi:hypothetical protein
MVEVGANTSYNVDQEFKRHAQADHERAPTSAAKRARECYRRRSREYHMNCSKWQRANIMSTHGAYAQNHQYSLHGRRSYTYRPLPDESEVTDDCPVPFPPALSRFRGRIAIIWRWNSAKEMALSPSVSCLKNSLVRSSS